MQLSKLDKKSLIALSLTTLIALVGYAMLNFLLYRYQKNLPQLQGVEQAPVIVINTFLNFWWFIYLVAIFMLFIKWITRRNS